MGMLGIAFVLLLGGILISRMMSERALQELYPEQKVQILDSFSDLRKYAMIPFIVLIVAYFLLMAYLPHYGIIWIGLMVVAFISIQIGMTRKVIKRLRELHMPEGYTRTFLRSRMVVLASFLLMLLVLVAGPLM